MRVLLRLLCPQSQAGPECREPRAAGMERPHAGTLPESVLLGRRGPGGPKGRDTPAPPCTHSRDVSAPTVEINFLPDGQVIHERPCKERECGAESQTPACPALPQALLGRSGPSRLLTAQARGPTDSPACPLRGRQPRQGTLSPFAKTLRLREATRLVSGLVSADVRALNSLVALSSATEAPEKPGVYGSRIPRPG